MSKKLLIIALLLISVSAQLTGEDYICMKYDKLQGCLTQTQLPADFVYNSLSLTGAVTDKTLTFQYTISTNSLSSGWVLVPVVYGDQVAIQDAKVDGVSTGLINVGRMFALPVKGAGAHQIQLTLSAGMQTSGITDTTWVELPLNISSTLVQIQIPADTFMSIEPHITSQTMGNTVTAQIGPTSMITFTLTRAPPVTEEAKAPKVYAEIQTLATIGEGLISVDSLINYNVLHTGVSSLKLTLSKDADVLDVTGYQVSDWSVSTKEGLKEITVSFESAQTGQFSIQVQYEKSFSSTSFTSDIPELTALGVERETGYLGVMAGTSIDVTESSTSGLTRIDATELPSWIWSSASRPILLAYKYLSHPWSLVIDAVKHEELPVLIATADSGNLLSVMAGNKLITQYTLYVKNNRKQNLEVKLPAGAEVWSTFVNYQPVKPTKSGDKVLIPLVKSEGDTTLQSFPVELVYILDSPTWYVGWRLVDVPTVDIPVSQLGADIYLPSKERAFFLWTDMEEGEASWSPPVVPLGGMMAAAPPQYKATEEAAGEMIQQAKVRGVLPVEVEVPRGGNLISLNRLIVIAGTPLSAFFIQLNSQIFNILAFLLILWLIWETQAVVLQAINTKKFPPSGIRLILVYAILHYIIYSVDWIIWLAILISIPIIAIKLILPFLKPKPQAKKKR